MPIPLLWIVFGVGAAAWLAYTVRRIRRHLLFFQIEEYNNGRFAALLGRNLRQVLSVAEIVPALALAGTCVAACVLSPAAWHWPLVAAGCGAWAVLYLALFAFRKSPTTKKALVLTARATRLLITAYVLALVLFLLGSGLAAGWLFGLQDIPASTGAPWWALPLWVVWALLISQAAGLVLIAANGVMYPVEASFRAYFVRSAQQILRQHPGLKVIAVTGSYGKTSTKEIIAHVLSSRYRVLKTPRSFNTLMGLCKVIREGLRSEHEIFVVEMGTYKKGEIDRLCRLTPPHIGVLTAVGPQHLERFKTIERVAEAKYELMQHLPAAGIGIFNGDDPLCQQLSRRPAPFQVWRYGLESDSAQDVQATAVTLTTHGTEFDVSASARGGGPPVHFCTALLGRHNVSNVLAAVTVALQCGLNLEDIGAAIATLEPVEHRLQRIQGAGGVTVIDDAYNANPAGVRIALEVLGSLPGGRKVLVTPGMVELGAREELEHRQMGVLAARVCDYVVLVGPKRTQAIAAGLRAQDFPVDRLIVVQDLNEATQRLQAILRSGDVVLFENDLPDTYAEESICF